jgi:cytosine/creatinine deaminase
MRPAIGDAGQDLRDGGIPIGSVLVHGARTIGRAHDRRDAARQRPLHGDMDALENAGAAR